LLDSLRSNNSTRKTISGNRHSGSAIAGQWCHQARMSRRDARRANSRPHRNRDPLCSKPASTS
jgi:hypothetical protein